jgi:hypothetical protein
MDIVTKEVIDKKEKISREILYNLPECFDLPERTEKSRLILLKR